MPSLILNYYKCSYILGPRKGEVAVWITKACLEALLAGNSAGWGGSWSSRAPLAGLERTVCCVAGARTIDLWDRSFTWYVTSIFVYSCDDVTCQQIWPCLDFTCKPRKARLVARCKNFEKSSFYIWSTKHKLIIKIITELVCKSWDESNEPN